MPRHYSALEDERVAILECCARTLDALRTVDPERAGSVERLAVALSRATRNLQARNRPLAPETAEAMIHALRRSLNASQRPTQ